MGAKNKIAELDENGWMKHVHDLKLSHRSTIRDLAVKRRELEAIIESDTKLTIEQLGEKKHRGVYKQWKSSNNRIYAELQQLKEMISDNNFIVEWMHTGKQPGVKRGIERRSAYQREKLMDPVRMQSFMSGATAGSPANLNEWQRTQIEDALCRLSPQERACYEMKHGQGFSFRYIASMMGIKASTVENYVVRAQKKVSQDLNQSLFLWDGE